MFRYFIAIGIILIAFKIIKRRYLIAIVPIGMLIMVGSVYIKNFFTRGYLNTDYVSNGNFLSMFLSTDFTAAGGNLQYLLNYSWTKGSQGFGILFTELLTPFWKSGVFFNPDHWFNYEVHTGDYHGYAFTLVGTGYIMAGMLGVIVVFTVVGLVLKYLYKNSNRSVYFLSVYFYMIPTMISSFRASLSSVGTGLFRVALLTVLFCYLFLQEGNVENNGEVCSN